MKYRLFVIKRIICLLLLTFPLCMEASEEENVYMLPERVDGVSLPVCLLNGIWDFKYSPEQMWTDIQVPGEVAMQGFAIEHDKPFWYRKRFAIPADYKNKRIILRFDGTYSYAKLSINGKEIRCHKGGFTRWETDITPWVRVGAENEIGLELTDPLDDISYASGYAHHPVGGILRDVTVFALPSSYICNVYVETNLDSLYRDAELRFFCEYEGKKKAIVELELKDETGREVFLPQKRFTLTKGKNVFSLPVLNPLKWDAEHPHLYTLIIKHRQRGKTISVFSKPVGFREVKVVGNQMLVNGVPVKLRGACRHDVHPQLGRSTSAELDSLDAVMFKEANMNFVRTSHYPPTERFLEYCNRYGIYVECETAVTFVDTYRQKNYAPGKSQNDSVYTDQYLGQCREMVNSFRSHPSIILWSIGNESNYGENFQLCWDWVKATDHTRPVIFSYPSPDVKIFDILSMHYQNYNGNLSHRGMKVRHFEGHGIPALFDEWAHPACYTYSTLRVDPNIREFWGQSLDRMWSGLFNTKGGLGGAIWGYVDETFSLPKPKNGVSYWKEFAHTSKPEEFKGDCVGYGEWGIVDVWRRKKPEFWSTKKAYSPVRILAKEFIPFRPGSDIILTVHNRFDHTCLDEIEAFITYKGKKRQMSLPSVLPHEKGELILPAEQWEEGEELFVEFVSSDKMLIDAYCYTLGRKRDCTLEINKNDALSVEEDGNMLRVKGPGFEIPFDKATGLITTAKVNGKTFINQGPFLHADISMDYLAGAEIRKEAGHHRVDAKDWKKTSFTQGEKDGKIWVDLKGTYKKVQINFKIEVSASGLLTIEYNTRGLPNGYLREAGISFQLSDAITNLEWERKGYWNYYPEGELSGNNGRISLYNQSFVGYGERPGQSWAMDTHNYYYWGDMGAESKKPLTQGAKGMKENIYCYALTADTQEGISIVSGDASVACRLQKNVSDEIWLYANNRWDYPEIAWGNYCKAIAALPCQGKITIVLGDNFKTNLK